MKDTSRKPERQVSARRPGNLKYKDQGQRGGAKDNKRKRMEETLRQKGTDNDMSERTK